MATYQTLQTPNTDEYSLGDRAPGANVRTFHMTLQTQDANNFVLRFKSWDNQLSHSFSLVNGANTLSMTDLDLNSISGILIESNGAIPDSTALTLDDIYAYSLVCAPALLTVYLRCTYYALLPRTIACTPVNSALCFSPGYYRRRVSRLVSCYALFK